MRTPLNSVNAWRPGGRARVEPEREAVVDGEVGIHDHDLGAQSGQHSGRPLVQGSGRRRAESSWHRPLLRRRSGSADRRGWLAVPVQTRRATGSELGARTCPKSLCYPASAARGTLGRMFWLTRKRFSVSYLSLSATSRSYFAGG